MTTNVLDIKAGQLASDSRWSIDRPNFVVFVDDTGFDKVALYDNLAFMFAGNAQLIQNWKSWLAKNPSADQEHPPVESDQGSMALSITDTRACEVLFEHGQNIQLPDARFAGTGSVYAHTCWIANGDARRAVGSAITIDWFSGGEVKYACFSTGNHNIENSATVGDLATHLLKKGMIMYKSNSAKIQTIQEAAANDHDVKALANDIATGKVAANAPCDAMFNAWTGDEKRLLGRVLSRVLPHR